MSTTIFSGLKFKPIEDVEQSLLDTMFERTRKQVMLAQLFWLVPVWWPFAILALVGFKTTKEIYAELCQLRDQRDEEQLLENIENEFIRKHDELVRFELSIYALIDLKNKRLAQFLYDIWKRLEFIQYNETRLNRRKILFALDVLALKLGYKSKNALVKDLVKKEKQSTEFTPNIAIEKVHFIDKLPTNAKCMVSGLSLDVNDDTIVACPHCGRLAKSDLLEDWLSENIKCPVCKRPISFDDCPIVKLKL